MSGPPTYAPITYSANDTVSNRWTGQGSVLTAQQGNYNFWNLTTRIGWLESNFSATVSIATITQPTPSTLLFTMSDGSTQGPFSVPAAAYRYRGNWAPSTSYLANDTFSENGSLYVVNLPLTSAVTFDPNANDGMGHDYYSAMLTIPGNSLPAGGAAGMALIKNSGTDYDYGLAYILPSTGSAGQAVVRTGTGPLDYTCANVDAAYVTFSPSTASALTSHTVAGALEELKADIASGGGIALSGLTDVNVTEGPGINGYYLTYNNSTGKWVASAASSNLSGLADVNVSEGSGIDGYYLKWSNATGKWIAAASSSSLAGLSDVNVTEGAGINGYFLQYNNGTSKWIAALANLSALSDVNVTEGSGIDGYFLKWSNSTGKWVASLTGATAVLLSGLSDVSVSEGSGIDGQVLYWNNGASKWNSKAISAVAVSGNYSDLSGRPTIYSTFATLTDVGVASPAAGQVPVYNGSQWVNKSAADLPTHTISSASGAVSVDRNNGETQIISVSGNITGITVSNWGASGQLSKLTLIIQNSGAFTVALPSAKWAGGSAPTVSSGTATDILTFLTVNAGSTLYGNVIGQNYS